MTDNDESVMNDAQYDQTTPEFERLMEAGLHAEDDAVRSEMELMARKRRAVCLHRLIYPLNQATRAGAEFVTVNRHDLACLLFLYVVDADLMRYIQLIEL